MKKFVMLIAVLALMLTACAVEPVAEPEEEVPAEVPEEAPAEPAVEEPAVEEPEAEEEVPEEEVPEEPEAEEEVPEIVNGQLFQVKEGDSITYSGKTIEIVDLTNYGSLLEVNVDGVRFKLLGTQSPEIVNELEIEIIENTFNENNMVKISVDRFEAAQDEYMISKSQYVTVSGTLVQLDEVKEDKTVIAAYVTIGSRQNRMKVGDTLTQSGLEVTLQRAFWKFREYAVLKVVPQ